MINKEEIIEVLANTLEKYDFIYALWLEGSEAVNKTDQYSDLDIWLDVEDINIKQSIQIVEKTLNSISKIDFLYDMNHPHSKIEQVIYHLENTSEFLMLDICWQLHSRDIGEFCYTENDSIENAKVIFDKDNIIRFSKIANSEYKQHIDKTINEASYRISQQVRVLKYVYRNQYLEALHAYNEYAINPLVKLLRAKYTPKYTDYNLLHISAHIPKKHYERLSYLCRISSIEDIENKIKEAAVWFAELLKEIDNVQ